MASPAAPSVKLLDAEAGVIAADALVDAVAARRGAGAGVKAALVLGYAGLIAVNVGSNVGWFGPTNAEISAKYPVPLTPSGYAFSIWGLIFGLQGWGVVWALAAKGQDAAALVEAVAPKVVCVWLWQCVWQVCFAREAMELAMACIALACVSAAAAAGAAQAGRDAARSGAEGDRLGRGAAAAFVWPSSINASWLAAATSVQVEIAFKAYGTDPSVLSNCAVGLGAALALLGVYMAVAHRDAPWALTAAWALRAIAVNSPPEPVFYACAAGAAVCAAAGAAAALRSLGCGRGGGCPFCRCSRQ